MTNLTRWNGQSAALSPFDVVNSLFGGDTLWPSLFGATSHVPQMDVYETEDSYTVELAVPGLKPDQFDISLQQNTLQIRGLTEARSDQVRYLMRERSLGNFSRTVQFPVPVDADKIQAELANGLLVIRIPKSEAAKPRRIQIRAS